MTNKVKFGLRNVHYAKLTETDGEVTYAAPKRIPGAVELSLEPRGDMIEFYADDMLYYSASNNQGYDGTLNVAVIPEDFSVEALGETKNSDNVIEESGNDKGSAFALMFEFDGDEKATRHVLYSCTASRPTVTGETKNDAPEPQTDELTFVASPRAGDYRVKAKTSTETPAAVYDAWYAAVYEAPDAPAGTEPEDEVEAGA